MVLIARRFVNIHLDHLDLMRKMEYGCVRLRMIYKGNWFHGLINSWSFPRLKLAFQRLTLNLIGAGVHFHETWLTRKILFAVKLSFQLDLMTLMDSLTFQQFVKNYITTHAKFRHYFSSIIPRVLDICEYRPMACAIKLFMLPSYGSWSVIILPSN